MRFKYWASLCIVAGLSIVCTSIAAQSVIEIRPEETRESEKYFRVVVDRRYPKSNGYRFAVIGNTPVGIVVSGKVYYGDKKESYLSAALWVRDFGKNEDQENRSWIMEVDLTRDIAEDTYLIVSLGSDGPGPTSRGRSYRIRGKDFMPNEEK